MNFEEIIGLEVHVELKTKSKIFCSCENNFSSEPNTNTCPVCLGLPGSLPVLNKEVVKKAIIAGKSLGCKVNKINKFDRKNYFYPDLPKAYQISQLYEPILVNGMVDIEVEGEKKQIRIHEIHIEEDAGKLIHQGNETLIDYNRCGVPLIEIVTEPDFKNSAEVKTFLEKLRKDLSFLDVSDAKMEEGSLRCDVNLSVRKVGQKELGTRTETKNLNSITSVVNSIEFEKKRQISLLEKNEKIVQETRKWDDDKGIGSSLRSKENAEDYRYFPDPDLLINELSDEYLDEIYKNMNTLPSELKNKYVNIYKVNEEIADSILSKKEIAEFLEKVLSDSGKKEDSFIDEVFRLTSSEIISLSSLNLGRLNSQEFIKNFIELVLLITSKKVNRLKGKEILEIIFKEDKDPKDVAKKLGVLISKSDDEILGIIKNIVENNPDSVIDYKNGKEKALGFLVGNVMRKLKGAGDPVFINEKLREEIKDFKDYKKTESKEEKKETVNKVKKEKLKKKEEKIFDFDKDEKGSDLPKINIEYSNKYRTKNANEISIKDVDKKVKLAGFVNKIRDHGGITFIDLRDTYGVSQLVVSEKMLKGITKESVISVEGLVRKRSEDTVNKKIKTGEVELKVENLEILSVAKTLPFEIDDAKKVNEEVRLKYRFLDLRNKKHMNNIILRGEIIKELRKNMESLGFFEIQTPILSNSSPEGARDYLIPSRKHKGKFYALPQAPQQFKQLLMVSGFDKYFQIAPCFRDEDARADRSPGEFYQLDFEMSYATEEDVFKVGEQVLYNTFKKFTKKHVTKPPFPIFSYKESLDLFGSDKPDLRNPLRLIDLSEFFSTVDFEPFKNSIVKGIKVEGAKNNSKKFFKNMESYALEIGMKGLGYISVEDDKSFKGPIDKFLPEKKKDELTKLAGLSPNDVLYFISDTKENVYKFSGAIIKELGERLNLIDKTKFEFCYINEFPMYELNEETGKIDFTHNPFSMPNGEMDALKNKDPLDITAKQYDIVCNGIELSSGAVRNHRPDIMEKAFEIAGYSKEVLVEKFSALYNAFSYGAPPHAGMAPGVDRIVMLLLDEENIREVIPFPLNKNAKNEMLNTPSSVSAQQLKDIHIKISE